MLHLHCKVFRPIDVCRIDAALMQLRFLRTPPAVTCRWRAFSTALGAVAYSRVINLPRSIDSSQSAIDTHAAYTHAADNTKYHAQSCTKQSSHWPRSQTHCTSAIRTTRLLI